MGEGGDGGVVDSVCDPGDGVEAVSGGAWTVGPDYADVEPGEGSGYVLSS